MLTVDTATATVRSTGVIGTQPQLYDQANLDVAVSTDAVWVSSFAENAVHRLPRPWALFSFQAPVVVDPGRRRIVRNANNMILEAGKDA